MCADGPATNEESTKRVGESDEEGAGKGAKMDWP